MPALPLAWPLVREIVCAASAHVNFSVLYQFVDNANRPWPTSVALAAGPFPVEQRGARSLPERWPAVLPRGRVVFSGSRPSTRAKRGSLVAAPFIGSGNGRQDARPRLAHRPVALLRRLRLDFGLP